MDNKKKIIVGVVGVLAAAVLVFILGGSSISAKSTGENEVVQGFNFKSPKIEQELLQQSTKKQMYDEADNFDRKKYDSLAGNLSFLQKMKKKFDPRKGKTAAQPNREENPDKELQMLMALQNNLAGNPTAQQGYAPVPGAVPQAPAAPVEKVIPKKGSYFFGAASGDKPTLGENLIPAETVDQGLLKQGSTIAIRTKAPIVIKGQNLRIPKGAVIYGVVQFQDTRLIININRYRRDNVLYSINVNAHDFDGRRGIHLKSRSIFSIPANVSEDVYDAAVLTYQNQSNAFSSDQRVPLEDVALLSAAKEVSRELFVRRRVFVPRKYHLWLTVNIQDKK